MSKSPTSKAEQRKFANWMARATKREVKERAVNPAQARASLKAQLEIAKNLGYNLSELALKGYRERT